MKAGLSGGNSRSFTPDFGGVLAVSVADFWAYITEIGDIQGVSFSCVFMRYLRARTVALRNTREF